MLAVAAVYSGPGVCYRCGFGNNPQHRYCTRCGYDLTNPIVASDQFVWRSGRPLRSRLVFETGPLTNVPILLHQETITIGRGGIDGRTRRTPRRWSVADRRTG